MEGQLRFKLENSHCTVSRGHYKGSAETMNSDTNMDSRVCATEVTEGIKGFTEDWAWKSCLYHSGKEYSYIMPMKICVRPNSKVIEFFFDGGNCKIA